MKTTVSYKNSTAALALLGLLLLPAIGLVIGCTSTLDGEQVANQAPNVFFVNIPPEGQQFSRNPVVYWFGSDPDGLIDYYRHHVATRADVEAVGDPMTYIAGIPDANWVINDVDPGTADPQTQQSIPLQADVNSPVLTFVDQFVFIQAFDEEGLGSDVKVRLFSRNNNPPQTLIAGYSPFLPFVNDEQAGGAITGIRMTWIGEDEIDWPSDPPPFQFQWRLYGPYSDAEYTDLEDNYFTEILQTADGRLFRFGDSLEICDTNLLADSVEITCTTYVVDANIENVLPTGFASLEPFFAINDSNFINDAALNRVADSSHSDPNADENGWTFATSDTIYDVFATDPNDTTVQKKFVFWVRSRDDAQTPDLTPSFTFGTPIEVIDPKQERDVLIVYFTGTAGLNPLLSPGAANTRDYWGERIRHWQMNRAVDPVPAGSPLLWDGTQGIDYLSRPNSNAEFPLKPLLQHKIMLLVHDAFYFPSRVNSATGNIFKAIDGKVNAWVAMRANFEPSTNGLQGRFAATDVATIKGGFDYINYFGVTRVTYMGWGCSAAAENGSGVDPADCPGGRIEDFIGTYSLLESEYPPLTIDTGLLHSRYNWWEPPSTANVFSRSFSWWPGGDTLNTPIGALPEVGWSVRVTPGTEVIYLYKSLYGDNHPNGFQYSFEGSPVAHRYDRGLFRTAHFNFTPVAFPDSLGQIVVNSTLDFLYTPDGSTAAARMSSAPTKATVEELAENYTRRVMENADPEDFEPIRYDGRFHQKALQEMYNKR